MGTVFGRRRLRLRRNRIRSGSSLSTTVGPGAAAPRCWLRELDSGCPVLVWNGIPTTNNAPAEQVLGQSGFDSDLKNAGAPFPQVNAIGMSGPNAVLVDDCGSLYVCDTFNGRVMIYTDVPTGNAPAADAVLGKADFTVQPSASVPASDAWMRACSGLAVSGSSLYVGDSGFNRVLRFSLAR